MAAAFRGHCAVLQTQGIIWQSRNYLGQNLYKDNSSGRTSGQMWKQTSVPPMYFIVLLCFLSPGNTTALLISSSVMLTEGI